MTDEHASINLAVAAELTKAAKLAEAQGTRALIECRVTLDADGGFVEYTALPALVMSEDLDLNLTWQAIHEIETTAAQIKQDIEACMRAESFGDARNLNLLDRGRWSLQRAFDALDYGLKYMAEKYDGRDLEAEAEAAAAAKDTTSVRGQFGFDPQDGAL